MAGLRGYCYPYTWLIWECDKDSVNACWMKEQCEAWCMAEKHIPEQNPKENTWCKAGNIMNWKQDFFFFEKFTCISVLPKRHCKHFTQVTCYIQRKRFIYFYYMRLTLCVSPRGLTLITGSPMAKPGLKNIIRESKEKIHEKKRDFRNLRHFYN